MSNYDEVYKLGKKDIEALISSLQQTQSMRDNNFKNAYKNKDADGVEKYIIQNNYEVSRLLLPPHLHFGKINADDIPFLNALKKLKNWDTLIDELQLISQDNLKKIMNCPWLLKYFFSEIQRDPLNFFVIQNAYKYVTDETLFPKIFEYGYLDFKNPEQCRKFKEGEYNEKIFAYVLKNDLLLLQPKEAEKLYMKHVLSYNKETLDLLSNICPDVKHKSFDSMVITLLLEDTKLTEEEFIKFFINRKINIIEHFLETHPVGERGLQKIIQSFSNSTPTLDNKFVDFLTYIKSTHPNLFVFLSNPEFGQEIPNLALSIQNIILKTQLDDSLNIHKASHSPKIKI